jgi:DNA helicase-4
LVDEAQDLSQDRKRIIRALLGQRPDIKLFAVGDDWQSIYRFSGADIDIMTNFPEHFGYTATNYLTRTFRSYQGLVDLAAAFVQKNPGQFKKTVEAHASHPGEQVIIDSYTSKSDMQRMLEDRLKKINRVALKQGQRLSVFILARYNGLKPPGMGQYVETYPHLDISFRSIHASKGLETDYVILLGVANGRRGFPSRITDDPLLHLVIPRPERFPDAEERRLMYVAITRAKRAIFILSDKAGTSPFVQELSEMPGVKLGEGARRENPCPECQTGELKRRSRQGSAILGCSNFPICRYTRPV